MKDNCKGNLVNNTIISKHYTVNFLGNRREVDRNDHNLQATHKCLFSAHPHAQQLMTLGTRTFPYMVNGETARAVMHSSYVTTERCLALLLLTMLGSFAHSSAFSCKALLRGWQIREVSQ